MKQLGIALLILAALILVGAMWWWALLGIHEDVWLALIVTIGALVVGGVLTVTE